MLAVLAARAEFNMAEGERKTMKPNSTRKPSIQLSEALVHTTSITPEEMEKEAPLTPQELAERQAHLLRIRQEYRQLRRNADAAFGKGQFDTLVRKSVDEQLKVGARETPALWISVARTVTFPCSKCQGSGVYHWGALDMTTGHWTCSGECYRCRGKGRQTCSDIKRNWGADNWPKSR